MTVFLDSKIRGAEACTPPHHSPWLSPQKNKQDPGGKSRNLGKLTTNQETIELRKIPLYTFHYTGCSVRIKMVHYHPHRTG